MKRRASLWLVPFLLSSLAMSSCAFFGEDEKTTNPESVKSEEDKAEAKAKSKIPTPDPICPQVAVVRGLDIIRDYGRETASPDQLVAAAKLTRVEGDCAYVKDDQQGIDVAFKLDMAAERGPRLGSSHATFPVFIAVLDPNNNVLNKNEMSIEMSLSDDEPVTYHEEPLHVFIPLPKQLQTEGPHYKVLAGFQLSPAQADEAKKALTTH